jgi:hypothetical protein
MRSFISNLTGLQASIFSNELLFTERRMLWFGMLCSSGPMRDFTQQKYSITGHAHGCNQSYQSWFNSSEAMLFSGDIRSSSQL